MNKYPDRADKGADDGAAESGGEHIDGDRVER
jgi:hypothetical protein